MRCIVRTRRRGSSSEELTQTGSVVEGVEVGHGAGQVEDMRLLRSHLQRQHKGEIGGAVQMERSTVARQQQRLEVGLGWSRKRGGGGTERVRGQGHAVTL